MVLVQSAVLQQETLVNCTDKHSYNLMLLAPLDTKSFTYKGE